MYRILNFNPVSFTLNMQPDIAIIGGTGLDKCPDFELMRREVVTTPYGDPSGTIAFGVFAGKEIVFLPRHGVGHKIPPHKINYRANLWALKSLGIARILSINAVGAIDNDFAVGDLVLPDQILDYTSGREQSFFDGYTEQIRHIDFTQPYSQSMREKIIEASSGMDFKLHTSGVYAATQGPRLETAAEIKRLQQDGATLVGMTGMPEAALARELDLSYVSLAMIVNMAAGITDEIITMESIQLAIDQTTVKLIKLISAVL